MHFDYIEYNKQLENTLTIDQLNELFYNLVNKLGFSHFYYKPEPYPLKQATNTQDPNPAILGDIFFPNTYQ